MTDNVAERVIKIIAQQALLLPEDIGTDTKLQELDLDSTAVLEIIFYLEEELSISIPFNANKATDMPFDMSSVDGIIAGVKKLIVTQNQSKA